MDIPVHAEGLYASRPLFIFVCESQDRTGGLENGGFAVKLFCYKRRELY